MLVLSVSAALAAEIRYVHRDVPYSPRALHGQWLGDLMDSGPNPERFPERGGATLQRDPKHRAFRSELRKRKEEYFKNGS